MSRMELLDQEVWPIISPETVMVHFNLKESIILLLWLLLGTQGIARDSQTPKQCANKPATLEIHLRDLGYQSSKECRYSGTGIPRDLSVLNDDYKTRLAFVDDKTLIVYQSHCQLRAQSNGPSEPRSMEAFFISPKTGLLISKKTWPTIGRRWLNDLWDTQARIMAVRGGFLVHAGNSLTVYSSDQREEARLALDNGPRWAVAVTPLGDMIHLQRIQDNNEAEGEWLASNSLKKLRNQNEAAGITSASDDAVVNKMAHCVQLQAIGESPHSLYCSEPSHLGLPTFLTDSEILSVYSDGFTVFSSKGERLWSRESNVRSVADHKNSLNGNRFAILVTGHIIYDKVEVPDKKRTIFVYDRVERTQVACLGLDGDERVDFELSPDGSMLAVLVDDTVRVYVVPGLSTARN